jgi:predicted solute-binding protein
MKIEDIEIVNTLNEIQKVNDMIVFHQNQPDVSSMSVENYMVMREDLLMQLNGLLKNYNLTFSWNNSEKIAA